MSTENVDHTNRVLEFLQGNGEMIGSLLGKRKGKEKNRNKTGQETAMKCFPRVKINLMVTFIITLTKSSLYLLTSHYRTNCVIKILQK